jgi:hypothetical protein
MKKYRDEEVFQKDALPLSFPLREGPRVWSNEACSDLVV